MLKTNNIALMVAISISSLAVHAANIQTIPSAINKEGEALTPLQRQIDNAGVTIAPEALVAAPLPTEYVPQQRQLDLADTASKQRMEQEASTPFADAFRENFGGITRNVFRVVTQKEGAKEVDLSYNKDQGRRVFRENYPIDQWDAYENTVNQSQADALIAKLDDKAHRYETISNSWLGTILGYLCDPILIALGFYGVISFSRRRTIAKTAPTYASFV